MISWIYDIKKVREENGIYKLGTNILQRFLIITDDFSSNFLINIPPKSDSKKTVRGGIKLPKLVFPWEFPFLVSIKLNIWGCVSFNIFNLFTRTPTRRKLITDPPIIRTVSEQA